LAVDLCSHRATGYLTFTVRRLSVKLFQSDVLFNTSSPLDMEKFKQSHRVLVGISELYNNYIMDILNG